MLTIAAKEQAPDQARPEHYDIAEQRRMREAGAVFECLTNSMRGYSARSVVFPRLIGTSCRNTRAGVLDTLTETSSRAFDAQ